MDEAELSELPELDFALIREHAEVVIEQRPDARSLYQRWEKQAWSAQEIDLGQDGKDWSEELPERSRKRLKSVIAALIIGEYTAVELLGPIIGSAPDEDSLVFLGTQMSDESRHTVFVSRVAEEVLGMEGDLRGLLPQAWSLLSPASRALNGLEASISRELSDNPGDYGSWIRAVTMFHLVTEGILALDGQRTLVHALDRVRSLPGVRTGFTAMTRDESRHIGFGMEALRTGVAEGHSDEIVDVLEKAVPLAVHIDAPSHGGLEGSDWSTAERTARRLRSVTRRRLRLCGLEEKAIEHLELLSLTPPPELSGELAPHPRDLQG